jgi:DNA polymerase (family X)
VTNAEIARVFTRIAVMLEMEGQNPFRVRAYREAARVIESMPEPVAAMAGEAGRLESVRGIGKDLAAKIRDLVSTGTTPLYLDLTSRIPVEVVALTEIQGLGPKRVKMLLDTLAIRSRDELETAAKAGRLRTLPGFGEKVEQNILKALAAASVWSGRLLLAGAWPVAEALAAHIRAVPGVTQVEAAGSFRRRRETVGDLDLVVTGGAAHAVMEAFVSHPYVAEVLGRGETKSSVKLGNGLQVDVRHVPPEAYGAALLYFTGSKEHNIELRKIAIEKGMSLNEYALTRGEVVAGRTEADIYAALGLAWIPPELRECVGEIDMAREGTLPRLIEPGDLVADLHMHTDRTDGRETLDVMVAAVAARGYAYCAITDHSRAAGGGGFDEARVRQSVDEIAAVRARHPKLAILHGLEVDILGDGALDLTDEGLALLDWVLVSIHSRFDQPGEEATRRVLRALENPHVRAMAHPTARMIGSRPGAAFDVERVFERAAELGVAMEINGQPDRLDLRDTHARLAKTKGVKFVIDTDAHSVRELDFMRFGVFVARRAGLTKEDVLNTRPLAEFRKSIRSPGATPPLASAPSPRASARPREAPAKSETRKTAAGRTTPARTARAKATAKTAAAAPPAKRGGRTARRAR